MPIFEVNLTHQNSLCVDFKPIFPRKYSLKIFNYDGPELIFRWGENAADDFTVAACSTQTFDFKPCVHELWGRTVSGSASVKIEFW